MCVEQPALGIAAQQRMMGILAMDVGQEVGHFTQLAQCRRSAIDIGARTPRVVDHSPQQAGIDIKIGRAQPCFQSAPCSHIKLGGNLRTLGPAAHYGGIRTLTQGQRQRIDKNRLAGAGLAGQSTETTRELQFKAVDNDEITNDQTQEHGLMARSRAPMQLLPQHGEIAVAGRVQQGDAVA